MLSVSELEALRARLAQEPPGPVGDGLGPVAALFRFVAADLKKEREFNERQGGAAPFCSICSLFTDPVSNLSVIL